MPRDERTTVRDPQGRFVASERGWPLDRCPTWRSYCGCEVCQDEWEATSEDERRQFFRQYPPPPGAVAELEEEGYTVTRMEGGGEYQAMCELCQTAHPVSDTEIVDTEGGFQYRMCEDCVSEHVECTGGCGRAIPSPERASYSQGGEHYCLPCANRYVPECEHCDERVARTYITEVRFPDEIDGFYTEHMCTDCVEDGGWELEHCYCGCGALTHVDVDYCPNDRTSIRNYSYQPDPLFFFPEQGTEAIEGVLYVGMELETEAMRSPVAPQRMARQVQNRVEEELGYPAVYCKRDASIRNGFEIVTHPMEARWMLNEFPWHVFDEMRDHGYRSYDADSGTETCGIHIHVSRTAFHGPTHAWKFLRFHYNNPGPLTAIGQRSQGKVDQWSRWNADSEGNKCLEYAKRYKPKVKEVEWCRRHARESERCRWQHEDLMERYPLLYDRDGEPLLMRDGWAEDLTPEEVQAIQDMALNMYGQDPHYIWEDLDSWACHVRYQYDITVRETEVPPATSGRGAVALRSGPTIELRYFRGNLRPDRVRKNVELVDAIFRYTRDLTTKEVKEGALKWDAFKNWLMSHDSENSPFLCDFIAKKNL